MTRRNRGHANLLCHVMRKKKLGMSEGERSRTKQRDKTNNVAGVLRPLADALKEARDQDAQMIIIAYAD